MFGNTVLDLSNRHSHEDVEQSVGNTKSEFGQEVWNEAYRQYFKARRPDISATTILLIWQYQPCPNYSFRNYFCKVTFYLVPSELCVFSLLIYSLQRAGNNLLIQSFPRIITILPLCSNIAILPAHIHFSILFKIFHSDFKTPHCFSSFCFLTLMYISMFTSNLLIF